MCAIARTTRSVDEFKAIKSSPIPKIIISASGMATGGRVLYHLKEYVGDYRTRLCLPATRRQVRGETG